VVTDRGHSTPLGSRSLLTENGTPESRLLPSKEMDTPPLDTYMARAHIAWAKRYRPHLLRDAA
jgi:hypothetical protein